ncbi:hypothetical protein BC827DRAFT_1155500 [Russula dissimulans]|nr:hypothetical protein BC827DRAFT_1155500 [Russula dissimulans]
MDRGTYSWDHASFPMENMSHLGHLTYAITIAANPTSDTRSFPVPILWPGFSSSLTQMPQNSTEVPEVPLLISNDSLTYVNRGHMDPTHEEVESINIPSDEGNQYSQSGTTSNTSVPSGTSRVPAIMQYQEQRTSQAQHRQLHQLGKRKKHAASSSQSARRPTSACGLGARNRPYSCDICGKAYAQRQGLGRHRRETHDAKSCKHCGTFRWGRPYVFKKHIQEWHPGVNPDAALKEAMGAGRGFPSVTRYPSPLQRDIPPEHDRRTCAEFLPHPLTPLHQVARTAPLSVRPLCPGYL